MLKQPTDAPTKGANNVRYLDLESPADRARLTDAESCLENQRGRLVILDEIHRVPELFAVLRGLVDLLLVRRRPPCSGNTATRLVRAPKIFIRDSGIAHALLGIGSLDELLGHPIAGPSWEGFVLENLMTARAEGTASYYRTSAGAEVDLVFDGRRGKQFVVEIKRPSAPSVGKGFWNACEDIGAAGGIVVYNGEDDLPMGDGVRALGLRDAIAWVRERS